MVRVPEGQRRVDRIREVLGELGGRARVADLIERLRQVEDDDTLSQSMIYLAVRRENERLESIGQARWFRTKREGEQHGFIALEAPSERAASTELTEIETQVRDANARVDDQLRQRLQQMDWQTFESTFLTAILEELGFKDVKITQRTRDGGVDARATYTRGIVEARAIISAKHWSSDRAVPATEVRNLRGIKGEEDTAIIITSGRISNDAKVEAGPGQNQRVVYLIDGDQLVEICKRHSIGVQRVQLPELLVIDESVFEGEETSAVAPHEAASGDGERTIKRLRDEMLGDEQRGLSVKEIATLTGLAEATVRAYLSQPSRVHNLGDRIREDEALRQQALELVARKRFSS